MVVFSRARFAKFIQPTLQMFLWNDSVRRFCATQAMVALVSPSIRQRCQPMINMTVVETIQLPRLGVV